MENETRKPRVLLVTEDFPPMVGGIATYLVNLARCTRGIRAVLAPAGPGGEMPGHAGEFRLSRPRLWPRLGLFQLLFLTRRLARKEKTDVVFFGHLSLPFVVSVATGLFWPRRTVVLIHGNDLYQMTSKGVLQRVLTQVALRRCSLVLCNSEFNARRVRDLGTSKERVAVLSPGVDLYTFSPKGKNMRETYSLRDKLVLLTVGRLVWRKNHRDVLQAVATLLPEFSNLVYVIVGSGPEKEPLSQLAADFGLEDVVLFIENATDEQVARWYRTCDLFVMPSLSDSDQGEVEGFGIAYVEAAASGKPVVAADTGGVAEAVQDGVTGILVPPSDHGALVQALKIILAHPEKGQAMGRAGHVLAKQKLSWTKVAERFDALLADVVKES